MSREHQDSLRIQIIDAMVRSGRTQTMSEAMFDGYIYPVLDAAMTAGELLVARNTVKQLPVHEAITAWLEVVVWTVMRVKNEEKTISKANLLHLLFELDDSCRRALAEAKSVSNT